jgi:hypothetical protein
MQKHIISALSLCLVIQNKAQDKEKHIFTIHPKSIHFITKNTLSLPLLSFQSIIHMNFFLPVPPCEIVSTRLIGEHFVTLSKACEQTNIAKHERRIFPPST